MRIDCRTDPTRYKHWRLDVDGETATLWLDVAEDGGLLPGYELKLNSYDLGVDIELADAVQRLRFEHPSVRVCVLRSAKPRVFSAGANIRMLAGASHVHKVNFCKFTNETRNTMEDASAASGLKFLAAVDGACAGGGYELALACDEILLVDDGTSAVALPEVPLLGVLPGTGGLTRVVDKRHVRRDRADVFAGIEEGVKGKRAVDWRLVDAVAPRSGFDAAVAARVRALAAGSKRPAGAAGVALPPLAKTVADDGLAYPHLSVEIDRAAGTARLVLAGPSGPPPADAVALHAAGAETWSLAAARALDDAILELRLNEPTIGVWLLETQGDPAQVLAHETALAEAAAGDWFAAEIRAYWKRVFKRLDVTSRSLVALIGPGSCFAGLLAELALAADRSYMLIGGLEGDNRPEAHLTLSALNFGPLPMANGLSRLATRFFGDPAALEAIGAAAGAPLDARQAEALGLVTFAYDDIDWEDEVRLALEERASFSPDALTGLEANLRFPGPETMETKIFARLSAWQNWIFQRPNAVGAEGALKRYGTGQKPAFDRNRT
ncbi:MAG: benzoyl-CoA-dihydrodiol lyase [Rhodospirillaceae bacterium]|nr:benzoyl-CoA-dihydrodiol lyase [Rhodospirillaceae bacterium]